ncbi:MAG: redoxin domain-containing protein [Bacteroidales bacterium]|nr:redoxin domain-containing protein [Bacteroidales bacterium]
MKYITTLLIMFAVFYVFGQTNLTEAEDFTVTTTYGEEITLFDILAQDKIVLLDFFSTTCGGCNVYAPHFQETYKAFGCNDGNVFFLSMDSHHADPDVIAFDDLHGIEFPSASGLDGGGKDAFLLYNVQSTPTLVTIMPDGTIMDQQIWNPTTEWLTAKLEQRGGLKQECTQGIETLFLEEGSFSVFPNPAHDYANLSFIITEPVHAEIGIADITGQIVKSVPAQDYSPGNVIKVISVEDLPKGFYFVGLVYKNQFVTAEKLIVQ